MLLTCVVAIVAVTLGAALGASRTAAERLLGPIRAAGLGSGALAVFGQLLPEAAHDLGFFSIVPFAVTLFGSAVLERILARPTALASNQAPKAARATFELGLIALGIHQLVEGVALGAIGVDSHHPAGISVALAISAHTVPLVAMFTLVISKTTGRAGALSRASVLLVASVAGVLASGLPRAAQAVESSHGWIHAGVAGLLLHAILHAAGPMRLHGHGHGDGHDHGHDHDHGDGLDRGWGIPETGAAVAGAGLVLLGIVAAGTQDALRSSTTWVVLALALMLSALVHRAWPHTAHMRALGLF
ncbi:MAG: hypothetical protein HOW73_06835 [Polyangiaceae bacterium]|nr:hypothetical protein [Polyangiaceae bacterium]